MGPYFWANLYNAIAAAPDLNSLSNLKVPEHNKELRTVGIRFAETEVVNYSTCFVFHFWFDCLMNVWFIASMVKQNLVKTHRCKYHDQRHIKIELDQFPFLVI